MHDENHINAELESLLGAIAPESPHPDVVSREDLVTLAGRLDRPLLIAGFSGALGMTAGAAVAYLADHWQARPIAEIDPDAFFDFSVARPVVRTGEDGERVLDWPEGRFWVARPDGADRDIVLFSGIEPHLRWRTYLEALDATTRALGLTESLLVASYAGTTPHTRPLPLRFFGDLEELAARIGVTPEVPDYEGPTSIAGALGVHERERGRRSSTLIAVAPFYMHEEPRALAMRALIEAIDRALGTDTDTGEIDARVAQLEQRAQHVLARSEQMRQVLAQLERQYDESSAVAQPAPLVTDDVMRAVEDLLRDHRDVNGPGSTRPSPR